MNNLVLSDNNKGSFLDRPEGKVGAVGTAAIVAGVGVAAYALAPPLAILTATLLVIMQNLVYVSLIAAGLGIAGFTLANPRIRMLLSYMYRSFWRAITGAFITIDPIGIMESYKEDLSASMEKMGVQIGTLKGQDEKLAAIIRKKTAEMEHATSLARAARDKGDAAQLRIQSNQMARLEKTLAGYNDMRGKITQLLAVLEKMQKYTKMVFEDLRLDIENRKEARATMQASYGAFSSAMKILKGDPASRAIYDQTVEFLDNDYMEKMGQIRQFMDESGDMISAMELEGDVSQTDALKKLDALEAKTQSLLAGSSQRALPAPSTPLVFEGELTPNQAVPASSLSKFLNKAS